MSLKIMSCLCGALTASLAAIPASADTFNVPGDFNTIQEAIDNASANDTILVGPGTYDGPIDFLTRNIIVKSTDGPEATIIDGANTNASLVSMIHCNSPARLEVSRSRMRTVDRMSARMATSSSVVAYAYSSVAR